MKPNNVVAWTNSLISFGGAAFWRPTDTNSLRRTANNTAHREGVTAEQIEGLIGAANNLQKPIPVNGHHEDKAFKFWRGTFYTPKKVRRDTAATRSISPAATRIILAYLDWHIGQKYLIDGEQVNRPSHAFDGLHDNTDESTLRYWGKLARNVFPIWRMTVPGAGYIDYVNIPWQQQSVNQHGVERLTVLQVGEA